MNDLIKWDYDASVQKMRPLVIRLKTITTEMLEELYQAHEALAPRREGKIDVPNGTSNTWLGYLSDIGLPRTTAHRWLGSNYDPIEKKKNESPKQKPIEIKRPIIDDEEYERRKDNAFKKEDEGPSLDEAFEDVKKLIVRQDNEEVFREFDLAALIDELRRRILTINDPSRRHQAINQIIKAMRELAIECEKASIGN